MGVAVGRRKQLLHIIDRQIREEKVGEATANH